MRTGLTQIYTGDGKGKTTAAIGQAVRAAGNGLTVHVFQFCKSAPSGERKPLEAMERVTVHTPDTQIKKFSWDMTPQEKRDWDDAQAALFDLACDAACDKQVDVVVLDELSAAIRAGAVDLSQALYLVAHKNPGTELIVTGRDVPQALIDKADYVTEMRLVKHPYDHGVHARRGIEY